MDGQEPFERPKIPVVITVVIVVVIVVVSGTSHHAIPGKGISAAR